MKDDNHVFAAFQTYIKNLRKTSLKEKTEYTDRPHLHSLVETIAASKNRALRPIHEAKRTTPKLGSPDFCIQEGLNILGYIETKKIGENLEALLDSEQIHNYKQLSPNILLTNYIDFIWIKGQAIQRASLGTPYNLLENTRPLPEPKDVECVQKLLNGFLSVPPKGITKAKELAQVLAPRSRLLRDFFIDVLAKQEESKSGSLYGLYSAFKERVFKEFRTDEFANVFAQMIAYGLFLARLNTDGSIILNVDNAKNYIPRSFELIQQLVRFLDELDENDYEAIKWVVEEIFTIINTFDLKAIHADLSFAKHSACETSDKQITAKDPYIYFYEDFLKEYDNELRRNMGVYYTPLPIVHCIVRGVEDILRDTFKIDGYADSRVTALDFATGTGTFLVEIFRHALESLPKDSGKRDLIIKNHLLKNFYGFEYMIAPYTIAHLKLSEFLKGEGYELPEDERLGVYLTNTLESLDQHPDQPSLPGFTSLDIEGEEAQKVKRKPILVIVGNPPYKAHSRNNGEFISNLINDYKFVDGKPLGEKNSKWLQDDYVKFIRFAQHKIDQVEEGIVGIVTNHSFLDNPTFRGMRQSLMNTFNQIYIINLHGNAKKKEKCPDGSKDENVFDIQQGVCISFFIKKKGLERGIYYTDWWGTREIKYDDCLNFRIQSARWTSIESRNPSYFLVPLNARNLAIYQQFKSIKDLFSVSNTGIITSRDKFVTDMNKDLLAQRITAFSQVDVATSRDKFNLKDTREKTLETSRDLIKKVKISDKIVKFHYRPFDHRWIFYDSSLVRWPVYDVMRHMLAGVNVGLVTARSNKSRNMDHFFCSQYITEVKTGESTTGSCLFPLYTFNSQEHNSYGLFSNVKNEYISRNENLSPTFRQWIDDHYQHHYSPEEVLGYIYGVLHSPTYRTKYLEFLRMDFPRIPFTKSRGAFERLSQLGWELVQTHLMKKIPPLGLGAYLGKGSHAVEKIKYLEEEEKLFINNDQCFSPIPKDVWEFHIGGYQVLSKYLKSRKGRVLSMAEIENVENVANILSFTIQQMKKLDEVYQAIDGEF